MLTLNQLLKLKEKTEYSINRLNIKTSDFGDLNTDYEISGLMPVKINIKTDMNIDGIEFNLRDLVHKYAKEKHGSRHIYGESCGIVEDNYKREFKIKLPYKIFRRNTSTTFSQYLYRWVGTLTNRIVFKRKTNEK